MLCFPHQRGLRCECSQSPLDGEDESEEFLQRNACRRGVTELLFPAQGSGGEEAGPGEGEDDAAVGTDTGPAAKLKTGSQTSRHPWSVSIKDRQNSRGTDRTGSVDSETSSDCRTAALQVARKSVLDQLNHILFSETVRLVCISDQQSTDSAAGPSAVIHSESEV
ncbi:unnamed protein product [Pleuronectes platessa]|uniref:Uncharacterized protein n=1 Tax=Pleuronectes platessa TaxID=8262 RepID=A0A9N7TGY4_PLEPL|nr:unnamed protein product [Pleuronectes platessa]